MLPPYRSRAGRPYIIQRTYHFVGLSPIPRRAFPGDRRGNIPRPMDVCCFNSQPDDSTFLSRKNVAEKSANRSVGANGLHGAYDCVHLKRVISVLQVVSTRSCTVSIVQPAAAFYLSFNRQTLRSEHSTSAWILSIMHSAETICSLQCTCTPSAACISYSTLRGWLSRSGSFRNHRSPKFPRRLDRRVGIQIPLVSLRNDGVT